jgi:hypothetical protein
MNKSALGFDQNETQMGYLCKTIDDGCAYDCALYLVQFKRTHYQIMVMVISAK